MTYDRRILLRLAVASLLSCTTSLLCAQVKSNLKKPRIDGEYVTVYRPAGDRFAGPDTAELKAGQWYEDWVPNDHAIVRGPDNRWHAIGITHPLTTAKRVHEGEFQSFHAVAPEGLLKNVCRDAAWKDHAGSEIAILESHASEVFQGENGQWYLSSAEWPRRGVSIARLVWE